MRPANPWKSYRQIATQTAPPGQLILMLFDGILRALDRARLGFSYTDIAERNTAIHNNLQHAVDIVRELNSSLDLEAGGQLAETLRNLYYYFETRLIESNLKKSCQGIDDVQPMIRQLRDAWYSMLNGESAPPLPAGRWAPHPIAPT
jgi:flagellar protein FliS